MGCQYCQSKSWLADNGVVMKYGYDTENRPILDINDHGHYIGTDAHYCIWCVHKLGE